MYNYTWRIPLAFISPCWFPFVPPLTPFYLLGTLLAVTGSVHLGLRLLINWPPLSQPSTQTLPLPNSQNPTYPAPHYDDLRNNPASSVRNIKVLTFQSINCRERQLFEKLRELNIKSNNFLTLTQQLKVSRKFNYSSQLINVLTSYSPTCRIWETLVFINFFEDRQCRD